MNRISRRRFLEQSMLATASVMAAPAISPVAAQQGQSTSPNERLSVAVIGVRGRGGAHAQMAAARKDCFVSYAMFLFYYPRYGLEKMERRMLKHLDLQASTIRTVIEAYLDGTGYQGFFD